MDIPKYRRLKYELEEKWRNFSAHRALPSEREIRRDYGLSLETVRKALAELESEGRIYRLPNKGSFISPPVRRKQFLVVGLEIAGADLGVARFLFGMNQLVHARRLGFLPFFVENGEFLEQYRELSVIYRDLAAVIFMRDVSVLEKTRAELERKEIPFIFYGSDTWESRTRDVHRILFSEKEIAETAVRAIGQSRSRKVVIVLPQPHGVMDERSRMFQIVAKKNKLSVLKIFSIPHTWEKVAEKKRRAILKEALALAKKESAIVYCPGDLYAVETANAAYRLGYRIPDDFALLGVDNAPGSARCVVPLTTIEVPLAEDGERSLAAALDLASGKSARVNQLSRIRLVKRESL